MSASASTPDTQRPSPRRSPTLVPKPPTIPAFKPFVTVINAIATQLEKLLPAYDADPDPRHRLRSPPGGSSRSTRFCRVPTGTAPSTLFTVSGVYILMVAAYQRYEKLATNHLPGAPTLAGPPTAAGAPTS